MIVSDKLEFVQKKKKNVAGMLDLETVLETKPKATLRKFSTINCLVNMHPVYFAIIEAELNLL